MHNWYETFDLNNPLVVSSRIRLARNIKGIPFPKRMNDSQKSETLETFKNLCTTQENITALCFDGEENLLPCPCVIYGKEDDGFSQSARLFDALRELDEMGAKKVYARCPDTKGMGLAVYNRLIRAAGFKIKVI